MDQKSDVLHFFEFPVGACGNDEGPYTLRVRETTCRACIESLFPALVRAASSGCDHGMQAVAMENWAKHIRHIAGHVNQTGYGSDAKVLNAIADDLQVNAKALLNPSSLSIEETPK